jgi:hypothetical protein
VLNHKNEKAKFCLTIGSYFSRFDLSRLALAKFHMSIVVCKNLITNIFYATTSTNVCLLHLLKYVFNTNCFRCLRCCQELALLSSIFTLMSLLVMSSFNECFIGIPNDKWSPPTASSNKISGKFDISLHLRSI